MINFRADIVGIDKQSDSSVLLSIDVLERGNATVCFFYVYRDTQPIQSTTSHGRRILIERANDCKLQDHYLFALSGIKKGKKYFFRLAGWGNFDLGGPNDSRFDFMGNEVEFTIQ